MIIEAGRLSLRALTPDDAEAIVAGDRVGRSWVADFPSAGDVNVAAAALEGKLSFAVEASPWGLFSIVERSSGLSVGGIGFKSAPNAEDEVEIGYGICPSFQGRGVATEAVGALCEFARAGARAVVAETDRANVASQRVLEKSGFQRSGESDELIRWRKDLTASALVG